MTDAVIDTDAATGETIPPTVSRDAAASTSWSAAAFGIAVVALAANVFITSPARFGDRPWPETISAALLRPIVEALALCFAFPTPRGIEVRNLIFALGAAALTLVAGSYVLLSRGRRERLLPREVDFDALARTPVAWWLVLIAASIISSAFSHAPSIAWGGVVIRFFWLAWWWPLAGLLTPRDAARLAVAIVALLAGVSALGLWYQVVRAADPAGRLSYPFGNEGWMGACLLPGVVIAATAAVLSSPSRRGIAIRAMWLLAAGLIGYAMYRTGTRSAIVGLGAAVVIVAYMLLNQLGRAVVVFVVLAGLAGGAWQVRRNGVASMFADRGASIRSRVEHEWPIAWRLISVKPILGHGEGGYTMLGGRIARDRQFSEPAITAIDRTVDGGMRKTWPDHTHNEYLELASDLGVVGMIAFIAAIAITLRGAARFVDSEPRHERRGLAIALSAALAAMAVEAGFSVALRNPGLAPIFLSVWAALWAIVRPPMPTYDNSTEISDARGVWRWLNPVGALVIAAACAMAWLGAADWRATLAHQRADAALAAGEPEAAMAPADLAFAYELDPFRHLLAGLNAIRARSELLLSRLTQPIPADDRDIEFGREALRLTDRLKNTAPRFLWLARLEADTAAGLAAASERLHRLADVRHYRQLSQDARAQQCRDEPFDTRTMAVFLQNAPNTATRDVLALLAAAARDGAVDDTWEAIFAQVIRRPDCRGELQQLRDTAEQDSGSKPGKWQNSLSPESFRLLARAQFLAGDRDLAVQTTEQAGKLYAAAGGRLAGAEAAALLEQAQYRFANQPEAIAGLIPLLERAESLRLSIGLVSDLRDRFGRFHGMILLAKGDEPEVRRLYCVDPKLADGQVGELYARLARFLLDYSPGSDRRAILGWARRGAELRPNEPLVWFILAQAAVEAGQTGEASRAAARFESSFSDKGLARQMVAGLRIGESGGGAATRPSGLIPATQSGDEAAPLDGD